MKLDFDRYTVHGLKLGKNGEVQKILYAIVKGRWDIEKLDERVLFSDKIMADKVCNFLNETLIKKPKDGIVFENEYLKIKETDKRFLIKGKIKKISVGVIENEICRNPDMFVDCIYIDK